MKELNIKLTREQFKKYCAGELRLVTKLKSGKSRLVPATPKGKSSFDKRAKWRAWYMDPKNRAARAEYSHKRYLMLKAKRAKAKSEAEPVVNITEHKAKRPYNKKEKTRTVLQAIVGRLFGI